MEVLCAETGKERKYSGLSKLKIIEYLMNVVSEKRSAELRGDAEHTIVKARSAKRQRKADHPSRVLVGALGNVFISTSVGDDGSVIYCKNSACRAKLPHEGEFCKRCSCCICYQYDDNKDPSLWLFCNSEPPFQDGSCGMSCHLECAMDHDKSGLSKDGMLQRMDGCFYCVSCGKVNDLLGCCEKQLMIGKDTRRVDILSYRLSLCERLLHGTEKNQRVYEMVHDAVKKLETELGPLTALPAKMGRGIVNRLSTGPEVQKLCALAFESLNSLISPGQGSDAISQSTITFEHVDSTSLTVVLSCEGVRVDGDTVSCSLWHRKACDTDYPDEETGIFPGPDMAVMGLLPDTKYAFKVVCFNENGKSCSYESSISTKMVGESDSPATNGSSLSNPSSVEGETNNMICCNASKLENSSNSSNGEHHIEEIGQEPGPILALVPDNLPADSPNTPSKVEASNGKARSGGLAKKRSRESRAEDAEGERFGHYVKVIRKLECGGHIEKDFREKFLTWYSLKATNREIRIVKVFIDTFGEDPVSLAGQLIDTFSNCVCEKKSRVVPAGLCLKLWH